MITTTIVVYTLVMVATYVLLARAFKKSRFYTQVRSLRQLLEGAPVEIRSKRDIRKYRKIRPYIKSLRRKMLLVTLVYTGLFLVVYVGCILVAWFISSVFNTLVVDSPIGIPFLSFFNHESGYFEIPVFVIVILALTGALYVFMREARVE